MKRLLNVSQDIIFVSFFYVFLFFLVYIYFLQGIKKSRLLEKQQIQKWSGEVKNLEQLNKNQTDWMVKNLFSHHDDGYFVSFVSDLVVQSGGKIMSISPNKKWTSGKKGEHLFLRKQYKIELQACYEEVKTILNSLSETSFLVEVTSFSLSRIGHWTKETTEEAIRSPLLGLNCNVTFYCLTDSYLKNVGAV